MVDPTTVRLFRIIDIYHLFHVGRFPGEELFFRQLHFAIVFARDFWEFAAQLVRAETQLVAGLGDLFSCFARSLGPGRISAYVLLLSGGVL